jgi:hypothetical protein
MGKQRKAKIYLLQRLWQRQIAMLAAEGQMMGNYGKLDEKKNILEENFTNIFI